MTKKVISVNENDTVLDATQRMKMADVGSVVVENNNQIVGLITDRDIVLRSTSSGTSPNSIKCRDIMSTRPVTAEPNMDVKEVADLMSTNQIRRIPVAENGRIMGMISLADITQARGQDTEAEKVLKNVTKKSYR